MAEDADDKIKKEGEQLPKNEGECGEACFECDVPPVLITIDAHELDKLKQEANEYKNKYLHLLADFDNARKRMQKERQEMIQYAVGNAVVDFLNPIDQFENALKFTQKMSDEVKNWGLGFQMIQTQFQDALTANGIVPFKSEGAIFDPHSHEAIEMIETDDVPPGIVLSESVRGYKLGNRILRPARVTVSKKPTVASSDDLLEEKTENNN